MLDTIGQDDISATLWLACDTFRGIIGLANDMSRTILLSQEKVIVTSALERNNGALGEDVNWQQPSAPTQARGAFPTWEQACCVSAALGARALRPNPPFGGIPSHGHI